MKNKHILPTLRRAIVDFIKEEEGTINKHALFSLGSFLAAGIISSKIIEASQIVVTHNHSDLGHSNCSHTSDTGSTHTNCSHSNNLHTNCSHSSNTGHGNCSHSSNLHTNCSQSCLVLTVPIVTTKKAK
ncbi:MAG: hypothetical protein ABIC91_00445 [Nanoarchaeota archaeon]